MKIKNWSTKKIILIVLIALIVIASVILAVNYYTSSTSSENYLDITTPDYSTGNNFGDKIEGATNTNVFENLNPFK